MTNQEVSAFFDNIVMLCITCGEPMRFIGEWPVQYPYTDKHKHWNQSVRWLCKTCHKLHERHGLRHCTGATMILSEEFTNLIHIVAPPPKAAPEAAVGKLPDHLSTAAGLARRGAE
jgi:hypothetical protein